MHVVSLRAKPLDRASRYVPKFYPKDRTHEGTLLPFLLALFMIQTIERTMFSQTFVVRNKMTPYGPAAPCCAQILKKMKMSLSKEMGIYTSYICTFSMSSCTNFKFLLFLFLFCHACIIPYSFEVLASRHLFEQNTFS